MKEVIESDGCGLRVFSSLYDTRTDVTVRLRHGKELLCFVFFFVCFLSLEKDKSL